VTLTDAAWYYHLLASRGSLELTVREVQCPQHKGTDVVDIYIKLEKNRHAPWRHALAQMHQNIIDSSFGRCTIKLRARRLR